MAPDLLSHQIGFRFRNAATSPLPKGRTHLSGAESSTTITITIAPIAVTISALVVVIDIMQVNGNTAVVAAANELANSRAAGASSGVGISADVGCGQGGGDRPGEILRNEDQVPLGVGRN